MTEQTEIECCSICEKPFKTEDVCADDITEGTCHAACLEGSPVVDLQTDDELPDGKADTYLYGDVMDATPQPHLMGHSLTSPCHGTTSRLGDQNDDRPKDSLACTRDGGCVCGNDHSAPDVWQLRHGGQDRHDWIHGDPARVAFGDVSSGAFSGSVLSAALLPRQNVEPVAYRHRLAGSSEWNVSNAGDMDGVWECMRHLGEQLEIEPLFAMAKSDDKPAGSRPMDEASLPNTSRLSQLEARTSCAALVNDQLTPPSPQPQNHKRVTTEEHNAAFDAANEALGGAFMAGFREGWIYAEIDADGERYQEMAEEYALAVDSAPQEAWDAHRAKFFAMLPLAAVPEVL
jgi:hypothetical protein